MNNGIAKFPIRRGAESALRLTMLLWGSAGAGKTTYAATAPGDKLWFSFGDSEHASVAGRSDVFVMDLSGIHLMKYSCMVQVQVRMGWIRSYTIEEHQDCCV